jgi:hypothetical protein
MGNIEHYRRMADEVIAWARRADVPVMSPPRVPEAAQAMSDEVVRLRDQLRGAVEARDTLKALVVQFCQAVGEPIPILAIERARQLRIAAEGQ